MDAKLMGAMMAGPMMMYMALAVLAVPFLLYVIARWRAHREQALDPQLGVKVALGYFALIALHTLLVGTTMFFFALLSNDSSDEKSALYRAALGLIIPGAIVYVAHAAMLRRTNQDQYPSVRRILLGYNLFLTGMAGMLALVLAFQALFERGSSGDLGRFAGAMVLVYGSAWATVGFQFGRLVLGGYSPPGSPSPDASTSPSQATTPAGPSLPALRDGAFPPLDPK